MLIAAFCIRRNGPEFCNRARAWVRFCFYHNEWTVKLHHYRRFISFPIVFYRASIDWMFTSNVHSQAKK